MTGNQPSLMERAANLAEIPNFFRILNLLAQGETPPAYLMPQGMLDTIRDGLRSGQGPIFNHLVEQTHPMIDALGARDVLDFVRGTDGSPGLTAEQFSALFTNNDGVNTVISEALETSADLPLIQIFTDRGFAIDPTSISANTDIFNIRLSEVGETQFSDFMNELSNEDTLQIVYQLPPEHAQRVLDGLIKDENGNAIDGISQVTLNTEATPAEIKDAIDNAIAERTDHEDGALGGIFNLFGGVTEEIFNRIRSGVGEATQAELNNGKALLASAGDLNNLHAMITDPDKEEEVMALLTQFMPQIRTELKRPQNLLFLFDAWPEKFSEAGFEFVASKLQQFSQFMPFIQGLLNFVKPLFAMIGVNLDEIPPPPAATEAVPEVTPAPDPEIAVPPMS